MNETIKSLENGQATAENEKKELIASVEALTKEKEALSLHVSDLQSQLVNIQKEKEESIAKIQEMSSSYQRQVTEDVQVTKHSSFQQ